MARRSITLWPLLESMVRDFQADLLKFTDRDVTFTDALNLLLVGGIMEKSPEKLKGMGKEWLTTILDHPDRSLEGVLDQLETLNKSTPLQEDQVAKVVRR